MTKGVLMNNKFFTIPNILSLFRVVLIPFIVWAYLIHRIYFMAVLIAISAVSDILDGIIARKFDMVTSVGKALDPIADKLTLLTLLVILCFYLRSLPIIILCVLFVVKEVIMGIEGLVVIKKTGTTYSANALGKATTVVLYINILLHLLFSNMPFWLSYTIIGISMLLVCLSLGVYTVQNLRRINRGELTDNDKN